MSSFRQFLKGFRNGTKEFGQTVGVVVDSSLLALVYLFGVGFTSFFARVFRKKFIDSKILKKEESYWSDFSLKKRPIEEYYRQF